MTAWLDVTLTFMIVALAAAYVIWRVFLPVRWRTRMRSFLKGEKAPCAPEPETGACAVGCSGCALGSRAAAGRTGEGSTGR